MAVDYAWTLQFLRAGTWRTMEKVTNASFTQGRQNTLNQYNGGSGVITAQNPSAWTYTPQLGDAFRAKITYGGIDYYQFYGQIKDFRIAYGPVQAMDEATIEVEDYVAAAGRVQLVALSVAQAKSGDQWVAAGGGSWTYVPEGGTSICSAQTFTGAQLEYFNKILFTENGRTDYSPVLGTMMLGRDYYQTQQGSGFTDGVLGANQLRYDSIQFGAMSDYYVTKVVVEPSGLAAQTAGTGTRGINVQTLDYTTTQALNNAQYILNKYATAQNVPSVISATDQQQDYAVLHLINQAFTCISQKQTVTFRGTTYNVILEGSTVTITPQQTRFTFYVSPADLNPYLVLNDTVYGKLDTGKLGF